MHARPADGSGTDVRSQAGAQHRWPPLGAALSAAHLRGLGKRQLYSCKQALYHEGEPIDSVLLIRSGLVKLLSFLANGRARIVRLHCEGHVLGLEGMLGLTFEHTAVAVSAVEVEWVSMTRVLRLCSANPLALTALLYQWHDALTQADKWIAEFCTGEIKPRVARVLQYLATLECHHGTDTVGLLTVGEIGEILGATPESVSRHLAAFKRQDILRHEAGSEPKTYRLDVERVRQEARA